ncbi:MAG: radical SAM protein [Candidatus Rifleibacteriota bacterium]
MIKVNEIFYSIQGESSRAGWPCVFVRLTGCNLRCKWCDTTYAYEEGSDMSIDDILHEVEKYSCELVEITGGEPLLQKETPELVDRLADAGKTVLIETNGSLDISRLNTANCIRIVDIKTPGSGCEKEMCLPNLDRLSLLDEIKFVIYDYQDYLWAKNLVLKYKLSSKNTVLFSPVSDKCKPRDLAAWILDDRLPVRFQLQMHKILWQDERGR